MYSKMTLSYLRAFPLNSNVNKPMHSETGARLGRLHTAGPQTGRHTLALLRAESGGETTSYTIKLNLA